MWAEDRKMVSRVTFQAKAAIAKHSSSTKLFNSMNASMSVLPSSEVSAEPKLWRSVCGDEGQYMREGVIPVRVSVLTSH